MKPVTVADTATISGWSGRYVAVNPVTPRVPEVPAKAGAVVATVTAGRAQTAPRTAARLLSTVDPMRA